MLIGQIRYKHAHQIAQIFAHTGTAAHRRCPRSDVVGLPTKVAELHLLKRITHKMS